MRNEQQHQIMFLCRDSPKKNYARGMMTKQKHGPKLSGRESKRGVITPKNKGEEGEGQESFQSDEDNFLPRQIFSAKFGCQVEGEDEGGRERERET